MAQTDDTFAFTYSAAQQKEIEAIREKYTPREPDKMEQLRRLDRVPSQKASAWAIIQGVLGSLVLGFGMSLVTTDIGTALGLMWNSYDLSMAVGITTGIAGLCLLALAYPLYGWILHRERRRIAPEILRLADELSE